MQQLGVDVGLDAEHQFLPLFGGFDRLGRELRHVGDERHPRRHHVLRRGIQHQARLVAQRHPAGLRRGQEKAHVHLAQVDQVQHHAAGRKHLAGFGHAVLHAPIARRAQHAVVDVGLDAGDGGTRSIHRRAGVDHLRAAVDEGRGGGRHLRARRRHRSHRGLEPRLLVVELLLGNGEARAEFARAGKMLLRRHAFGFVLRHPRLGSAFFGLALVYQALGGGDADPRPRELRLGLGALGFEHGRVHARQLRPALTKSPSWARISLIRPGILAATSISIASMRPLPLAMPLCARSRSSTYRQPAYASTTAMATAASTPALRRRRRFSLFTLSPVAGFTAAVGCRGAHVPPCSVRAEPRLGSGAVWQ